MLYGEVSINLGFIIEIIYGVLNTRCFVVFSFNLVNPSDIIVSVRTGGGSVAVSGSTHRDIVVSVRSGGGSAAVSVTAREMINGALLKKNL